MTAIEIARGVAFLVLGLALGAAFYRSLRTNVSLYLGGTASALGAVAAQLARIAIVVLVFVVLARFSPAALVLALGGFTASGLVLGRRVAEARS